MPRSLMLAQAVRNAVSAEMAAFDLYTGLAGLTDDAEARDFLLQMADQEKQHAEAIEDLGSKLGAGELPLEPSTEVAHIEAIPGWRGLEGVNLAQALEMALDAEHGAELVYDSWSDMFSGPMRDLFATMAATEAEHARRLEQLQQMLSDRELGLDATQTLG